jgi:hypothetical protein
MSYQPHVRRLNTSGNHTTSVSTAIKHHKCLYEILKCAMKNGEFIMWINAGQSSHKPVDSRISTRALLSPFCLRQQLRSAWSCISNTVESQSPIEFPQYSILGRDLEWTGFILSCTDRVLENKLVVGQYALGLPSSPLPTSRKAGTLRHCTAGS